MYKLLIVEDEKWEREGLIHYVNWTELGIEIVGTAANGLQGLRLAREHLPDIILTDIKMPKMDGLKLSEEVRNFLPGCRIIIITGYDDFEYAKDAIQFDVCEYLLKPIQKKPLMDAITRALQGLTQANKDTGYVRELKARAAEQAYLEKEKYLHTILDNASHRGEVDGHYRPLWEAEEMAAAVLKFDILSYCYEIALFETRLMFREIFKYVCRTVDCHGIVAQNDGGLYEIILCMPTKGSSRDSIQEMLQRINKAKNEQGHVDLKWAVGVGSVVKSAAGLAQSYCEARAALNRAFFLRNSDAVFYEDLCCSEDMDAKKARAFITGAAEYSKEIMNSVVTADQQAINCLLESFFDYIYNSCVDRGFVCNYFLSLLNELSLLVMNVDGSSYLSHRLNEARLLDSFVRLEDIKKWFQVLFVEINHSILAGRMNRQKHVADQVMDFIIKQYNTDLGLDEIASKIGYSPGYLGGLFKQHTGRGFSESLTEHRIKKAEELLRTQTYSIMDIAKTVGFESASYFNTVFKKAYGVTPAEFRRIRSDEDEENA